MRCIHLVIGYKGRVRGRTPTSKIVIHRGNCAKLGLERFEDGTFRLYEAAVWDSGSRNVISHRKGPQFDSLDSLDL